MILKQLSFSNTLGDNIVTVVSVTNKVLTHIFEDFRSYASTFSYSTISRLYIVSLVINMTTTAKNQLSDQTPKMYLGNFLNRWQIGLAG